MGETVGNDVWLTVGTPFSDKVGAITWGAIDVSVEEPDGNIVGESKEEAVEGPEGDAVPEAVGELAVGVSVSDSKGKRRGGTVEVAVGKPLGDAVGVSSCNKIFGVFGGHVNASSLGKADGDGKGLAAGTPEICNNGESPYVQGDTDWPSGSMLVGFEGIEASISFMTSGGFCDGLAVGMPERCGGNEQKLMEVTAAELVRLSLICLTFSVLTKNS